MKAIIEIAKILITIAGFIPMFFNLFLYTSPILAPLIFIIIDYYIYKNYKNNNNALVYAIISEIFSYASYILQGMAPGTDDTFAGLKETAEYTFYGCFTILLCLLFWVLSILAINKYKLQVKALENNNKQEESLPKNENK